MKHILKHIFTATAISFLVSACSAPSKVAYLVDAETIPAELLAGSQGISDPVLAVGDLLNIQVSGTNMAAMAPFNKGTYVDMDGKIGKIANYTNNYNTSVDALTDYYLVNSDGCIDFPILGKIKVTGLTKGELSKTIAEDIYPKYSSEKPMVDVRLMNFRVVVAGAVKTPGVYQSDNERMTFLEAIAKAGDLDIKGDRENILLYRTNADGTREVHRIDIHDRNFLLSPYFTLQQNDIIYVEPNKSMRASAWQLNPAVGATISIVGGMSSLASLIIGIVNLSK